MPYRIGRFAGIDEKIQILTNHASKLGVRKAYRDALNQIMIKLQSKPLEWGDPEYNTKKEGGIVCHGIDPILCGTW